MKFAVVGAGGVGGFFGGKLAKSGVDVWFLARGKHLEGMKASGLRVNTTEGSFTIAPGRMTERPEEIGPCNVILLCVKSYDTESAARQLKPLLNDGSIVISLQNGIDNEERIGQIIDAGTVWGGVSYIYSTITAPGEITQTGGPKKIIFGPLDPSSSASSEFGNHILSAMRQAGVNAAFSEDIRSELWKKFVFITSVAGLTAMTRLTLGEILSSEPSRSLLVDAMKEVLFIAQRRSVNIQDDYIETVIETLKRFDNNSRSSLYHDLVHNKPMEIEALSGTVVRYGAELGIATPIHRTIYASLIPYHNKHTSSRTQTS